MLKKRRSQLTMFVALCTSVFVLSACVPVTREAASSYAGGEPAAHGEAHDAPHWGYTGDTGPAYWGELNPEYVLCETGTSQSPVNIDQASQLDLANIEFSYQPSPLTIVNNGHTIQVTYADGSFIELDGVRYNLKQFHVHAPSEHEINGQLAAMELHLVHKSDDGKIAVVGILFKQGAENAALSPVWAHLPTEAGAEQTFDAEVDAATLLPADKTSFRYAGSLTTPPCTEGVNWLLMTQAQEISPEQLRQFTAIYDGNNRPVQPLNGREIDEDVTP